MQLTIQNYTKVIGTKYHQDRFVCLIVIETPTNYRFQFRDNGSEQLRMIWIEVGRIGHYNRIEGKWEYRLNYPNNPIHIVTADWLRFPPNAVQLMEDCLNYSL